MRVLDSTFKFLTICGCWRPDSWTSSCKRVIYHTHTFFVLVLINTFTLSQLLDIILTVDNADDFTDNFYMLLAMIVSCCKMLSMLINRKNIALLTNILTERPCRPLEPEEMEIHNKFDKGVQANTIHYAILVETTCVCITLTSLLTDFRRRTLTFRAWLPYDYSSPILFYITYAHQLISLIIGSVLHVACDGLICGLLVHICCQIEILESRLRRIAYKPGILPECILQHSRIFDFAITVNEKFRFTIAIQFMVSTLVVCFNLYQLTRSTTTNAKYVQLVLYMCSMLTQIFFYCWYGNEVKLKSRQLVSNIFDMEWCILDQNKKKTLLLIMRRSTVPIEFTSAYIISMNLDSFVGLLKTSYSAYNILQQIKLHRPSSSTEMEILNNFDKSIQKLMYKAWLPFDYYSSILLFYLTSAHQVISLTIAIINTRRFICLGTVTCLCVVLTSLSVNFRIRKLTYRAWLPFDYSSTLLFYLMYAHQLICLIAGGFLNIGCDTLICGLLVHICCQIEILTYRLKNIVFYSNVLRDCVHQHYHIFRLAFIVNAKFRLTIAIQFITSTLVVCFSLYQLSTATTKAKYIEMTLYISCMLTEIFFYCWYGNELKIKSHQMIDNIFEIEWLALDENRKKSLMIIMSRAIVPVQITCAYIVPMDLNSFMSLLKTSYSTYNLLQQIRE
ncbi:PREDICTED: odorant receptor 46a-like [Trachymyrmex septentrionalis]|uniref:odorant receptor 46a-like n=1 Tax=Trachymyrmex septentrionalis TaxID=34720 RepID=UPI00084F810E|nr:PREDICTED: odorant receptor 46a-like [Trachymyrmex septentrionalis]